MGTDRIHLLIQEIGNIDDERGLGTAGKYIVRDLWHGDLFAAGLGIKVFHTRESCRFTNQVGNMIVIRVRIGKLVGENNFRFKTAKGADQSNTFDICHEHMPVGQTEVLANIEL